MTRLTIALAVGIVAATVLSGPAAKLFGLRGAGGFENWRKEQR